MSLSKKSIKNQFNSILARFLRWLFQLILDYQGIQIGSCRQITLFVNMYIHLVLITLLSSIYIYLVIKVSNWNLYFENNHWNISVGFWNKFKIVASLMLYYSWKEEDKKWNASKLTFHPFFILSVMLNAKAVLFHQPCHNGVKMVKLILIKEA